MKGKLQFARVLGRKPILTAETIRMKTIAELGLFSESFGPPERKPFGKSSLLLWWNFQRIDGNGGFSIFAKVPANRVPPGEIEFGLAARRSVASFSNWTMDRLNAVANAVEPPLFLNGDRFAIRRIR